MVLQSVKFCTNKFHTKLLFMSVVIASAIAWAIPARAQVIEEIIVQAQRRAQDIQDVPISITAFSGDFITQHNMDDITQLAPFVANFNISQEKTLGNTKLNIRGVGSDGNSGIEPSVAVFVDGVYRPRGAAVIGSMVDIQGFEVLRGPQGVQFGRNTPMGAVNVTTAQPMQEFAASMAAELGSDNRRSLRGMINGAINDDWFGRGALYIGGRSGYTFNTVEDKHTDGRDEVVARVNFKYAPSDDFDITFGGDWSNTRGGFGDSEFITFGNEAVSPLNGNALANPTTRFLDEIELIYGVRLSDNEFDHVINDSANINEGDDKNWGLSVNANWQVGGGHTLNVIGSYREWDLDQVLDNAALPVNIVQLERLQGTEQHSLELRILSDADQALTYVGGLFYYNETYDFNDRWTARPLLCNSRRYQAGSGFPGNNPARSAGCLPNASDNLPDAQAPFRSELDSYAGYASATYDFTDQLSLTGGVRFTRDEKVATQFGISNIPLDNFRRGSFDGDRVDEETTWQITGQYRANDDLMLFATASTGFKSGGFSGSQNARDREFGPESSDNYEIGLKGDFADGRVRANLTVFRTELSDQQSSIFNPVSLAFTISNAGELRTQGIEADFVFVPVDELTINASVGYLDSEYQSLTGVEPPPGFGNLGDLPNSFVNADGEVSLDLAGLRRHDSPEWQGAVSATWRQAFSGSSEMDWYVQGSWFYTDSMNKSADLGPLFELPSRSLFNLGAGFGPNDGRWDVSLWAKNITDEKYCTGVNNQSFAGFFVPGGAGVGISKCDLGAPSTWGVQGRINFE